MVNWKLVSLIFGIVAVTTLIFIVTHYGSGESSDGDMELPDFIETDRSRDGQMDAAYIGSKNCSACHLQLYNSWNNTTHPRKLVNRSVAEAAELPIPDGVIWDDISYVIGHKWKIRYVNTTGYIITSNGSGPGGNMWDVADQEWADYHAGEQFKPYNCGRCHTTGWIADEDWDTDGTLTDNQDGLPGIHGVWNETGIGCEACHGPGSVHEVTEDAADIVIDTSSSLCGKCHSRGDTSAVNPDRKHHEQFNDWNISGHKEEGIDCIVCHNPHDTSDPMYADYGAYDHVEPAKVSFYNGSDDDINTTDYIQVSGSEELCGKCHNDPMADAFQVDDLDHGNDTIEATCVDCHMAKSRKTINKWDIRSHTFKVDDGVEYDTEPTYNFPEMTCEQSPCHTDGLSHYEEWKDSAHANSNHGYNSNTYCAHCMSPFQYDPEASYGDSDPVSEEDWTGINCAVCHDIHGDPSGISLFNGTAYEEPVEDPSELCGACHQGSRHPQYPKWNASAHSDTYHGYNDNTYCAHCMSPFQAGPEEDWDRDTPVGEENWTSVGCAVCHNKHSLELSFYNGSAYEEVETTSDLCGKCHRGDHHPQYSKWNASAHADTYHGYNGNTYCAHCMSPFQYEEMYNETTETSYSNSKPISPENWTSVGCTVCHDQHSLELAFFNGTEREEPVSDPSELCGRCHRGDRHPQYPKWNSSAHANSYHGYNDNTYCAHCMSPFQAGPEDEWDRDTPVGEENWTSIGCIVCHDKHSLELSLYNGSAYNEVEDISKDLCMACHQGDHHPEGEEWNSSAHADSYHGYNDNTYCAHCMSPFQAGPEDEWDRDTPVGEDNWTSVSCIVCHDKHSLELSFYNGSEYVEVTSPSELCGQCHRGDHHPEYPDWNSSAHADTYLGYNDNTYCAHCMSPFQAGPEEEWDRDTPVGEENWTSVGCTVCHDKHSLELSFYNGSEYNVVEEISKDLCMACHQGDHHPEGEEWNSSAHANSYHGYNGNTYCAHCMSPFQYEEMYNETTETSYSNSKPISEENWTSIGCTVCHDQHSLELAFFNGTEREEPVTNPADLCGACHQGDRHPQYPNWNSSVHATTAELGHDNDNTFCTRCHSPFQSDPEASFDSNEPVDPEEAWGITCTVCHKPHSLELQFWNGSAYEDVGEDSSELCSKCHQGTEEFEGAPFVINIAEQWENSGHSDTYKGFNGNTQCAHCMSPFQAGDVETQAAREPVSAENWSSVGCTVCHEPHSLDLMLYNGSAYQEVEDTTELCGSCHTMGDAELGDEPHHPQNEMREGTGGIGVENVSFMASATCGDCHAYGSDHSFQPQTAACADCHQAFNFPPTTNESARAMIEDWQSEFNALFEAAEANLTAAEMAMESAKENGTWDSTLNDTYNAAFFNVHMADADSSEGAHNPDYAEQLLEKANEDANVVIEAVGLLPPIKVTPANGATNVPPDTLVTVRFEKEINFTEFKENGYLFLGGVNGTLSYDSATHTVTLDPSDPLAYGTSYTASLSKDVHYQDGTSVIFRDFKWSFTTVKEDAEVEVTVGPILDEKDDPLVGAKVTITVGGEEYSGVTDESGYAKILIPFDKFSPGTFDAVASKDGYDDLKFEAAVDENGTYTPPEEGTKLTKSEEAGNTWLVILIVVIVVIIILAALFFLTRKKPEEAMEEMGDLEEPVPEEKWQCPECDEAVESYAIECEECGAEFEMPEKVEMPEEPKGEPEEPELVEEELISEEEVPEEELFGDEAELEEEEPVPEEILEGEPERPVLPPGDLEPEEDLGPEPAPEEDLDDDFDDLDLSGL